MPEPLVRATLSREAASRGVKESKNSFHSLFSLRFDFVSDPKSDLFRGLSIEAGAFRFALRIISLNNISRFVSTHFVLSAVIVRRCPRPRLYRSSILSLDSHHRRTSTTARQSRHSPNDWRSLSSGRPIVYGACSDSAVDTAQIFTLYWSGPKYRSRRPKIDECGARFAVQRVVVRLIITDLSQRHRNVSYIFAFIVWRAGFCKILRSNRIMRWFFSETNYYFYWVKLW